MNDLVASLRAALQGEPRLRVAVLFGPRARGNPRPDSDVDVAILPADPALTLRDEHGMIDALERAGGHAVDLVRLDQANDALLWRIARDGIVLVSDPPHAAPRLLARIAIEHDERSELETAAARLYRAALARGAR